MELKILSPVTGGTPERVSAEVTRLKETLGQGGGYILSSVNKITPDAPLEQTVANIVAMYETAHAVGTYR
jgi:uroporphyrinogen-III decarboxylase